MFIEIERTNGTIAKINVLSISEINNRLDSLFNTSDKEQVIIFMNNGHSYYVNESYYAVTTKIEEALSKIKSEYDFFLNANNSNGRR